MKTHIGPAIRLTLVMLALLVVIYPLVVSGTGRLAPGWDEGENVIMNGKVVGYKLIGQKFTQDHYFAGCSSVVDDNATRSASSNKGLSNPDCLKTVQTRIDTFLKHDSSVKKVAIQAELVTASGSGLDPDLSPAGAKIQIPRIATVCGLSTEQLTRLVNEHTQRPLFGIFGPTTANVLDSNVHLDQAQNKPLLDDLLNSMKSQPLD